jgi:phosphate transport system protein
VVNHDRRLAYNIILRDLYIDDKEKEIDRLCLEFIVRQQPVAQQLRFVYSTIKINLEIERVGDYAESVARQVLKLGEWPCAGLCEQIKEQAEVSIAMFRDAIRAFMEQDVELARKNTETKDAADALRTRLNEAIVQLFSARQIDLAAMESLFTIIRRFERVADQARNICLEVIYLCTGDYAKHPGADTFRILFVDRHNSCLSRMAEAIAQSLKLDRFVFSSAGLEPRSLDRSVVEFMQGKGCDLSRMAPRALYQVPNLEHYQMIVALSPDVNQAFPAQGKTIFLDWPVAAPALLTGTPAEQQAALEKAFQFLSSQVRDLVEGLTDPETQPERSAQ